MIKTRLSQLISARLKCTFNFSFAVGVVVVVVVVNARDTFHVRNEKKKTTNVDFF